MLRHGNNFQKSGNDKSPREKREGKIKFGFQERDKTGNNNGYEVQRSGISGCIFELFDRKIIQGNFYDRNKKKKNHPSCQISVRGDKWR